MFNPNEHMISLKGKDYLKVMWRLVWFREEHPDYTIDTTPVELTDKTAMFKAEIKDESGRLLSSGHGFESTHDFADNREKAETKAVGRALAMLGYGTQFAPELDEGERIVDSPVKTSAKAKAKESPDMYFACEACGAVLAPYKNEDGKEISIRRHAAASTAKFGKVLCLDCIKGNSNDA